MSENLDGKLLHLETFQYLKYLEEYNKQQAERDAERYRERQKSSSMERRKHAETELAINAVRVQQNPRNELNVQHPRFMRGPMAKTTMGNFPNRSHYPQT